MTQMPRRALVLLATLMATASAAIFLTQFQSERDLSSSMPSVTSSDSETGSNPLTSNSGSSSSHDDDQPLYHHYSQNHHHPSSVLHGPATLQESLSIVSRNEFYAWVREWVVLFIAFLFLYTVSYSILEWLRWKVRTRVQLGGGGGGINSRTGARWRGGSSYYYHYKSRSRSMASPFILPQQQSHLRHSLTGIEQELSDYTRKRRRISSAVNANQKPPAPNDPWDHHRHPEHHRHRSQRLEDVDDDQDELVSISTGVDQLVIMVVCAIGLAVAQGSFLMLPTNLIVHAVFAAFGTGPQLDRLYLEWLAPSLLYQSAAKIALLTDLAMFLLVPFAFFYHEQEQLQRRFWPKCRSALAAVMLVDVLYIGGVWAVQHLILLPPANNSRSASHLLENMSPIAVMRTSRIVLGWAVFVATVPLGMMQLFRFAARLPVRMGSRQYAKARLAQLECEHAVWVAKLEDKDRQMARERASVATAASSLSKSMSSPTQQPRPLSLSPQQNRRKRSFAVAGPAAEDHANPFYGGQEMSRYDILGKLRLLEYEIARLRKELYVSPWKRNAAFFGLLAISLSIYGRLLVLLAKSLIFGHPVPSASTSSPHVPPPSSPSSSAFSWMEYNTVSSSEATTMASNFAATAVPLGPSSHFPTMPWAMWLLADTPSATRFLWDAAVDIFWIFMVMALALYGLYHHPYYRKLRPRQGRTTPLAMIANVPIVLTLATASWSLMVDCLGILQSPSVWAVRGTGARTTEPMTTTTTTTTTTTAATTGFLPLRAEDPTRQLLWDTDMFDLVLGDKRQVLESLVRTAMFVMLSMLGAQWIVHRLIGLQNRR